MIKTISQVRFEYSRAYRRMRLQGGHYQEEQVSRGVSDAQENAKRSYDNREDHFVGWVNRDRWSKFIDHRMVVDGWIEETA